MLDYVGCFPLSLFVYGFRWGGVLHQVRHGKGGYSLAGLVSQPASSALVLAAAEDVPDQALAVEERFGRPREPGLVGGAVVVEGTEARLDQREAAADPVAVAAVDELVGAAGEAGFRGVLARREPGDEAREVEVSGGWLVAVGAGGLWMATEGPGCSCRLLLFWLF